MSEITKTWSKAGSLPGQYQKLTIKLRKREGGKVKVSYKLYAKSLGYDYYTYKSRHNIFKIECLGNTEVSRTYQLYGTRTSGTYTGEFTISGVKNKDDDLVFYYSNSRVWPGHTNSWDPRSTGVVKRTQVGTLKIPKNEKHSVDFDEVVTDKEYHYKCWHGKEFMIPFTSYKSGRKGEVIRIDNHFFDFKGWTTTRYFETSKKNKGGLNLKISDSGSGGYLVYPFNYDVIDKSKPNVVFTPGNFVQIDDDIDLYATWRRKKCTYKFHDYQDNIIEDLTRTPKCGDLVKLVSLDSLGYDKGMNVIKIPGYKFSKWKCGKIYYKADKYCFEWPADNKTVVNFYPIKEPLENDVIFKLPFEDRKYKYITDDKFDISKPLSGYTTITLKPGYKLVGWSTMPPSKFKSSINAGYVSVSGIAYPNQAFKGLIKDSNYYVGSNFIVYPTSGSVKFKYSPYFKDQKLILYPYYEYYTTSYVYIDGEWKLAMPYVYTNDEWKMALSYVYTNDEWKL